MFACVWFFSAAQTFPYDARCVLTALALVLYVRIAADDGGAFLVVAQPIK